MSGEVRTQPPAEPAQAAPRPARGLVAGLCAAVIAVAGAGYWWTGSPGMPSAGPPGSVEAANDADAAMQEQQFTVLVEQLAQRLADKPNNPEGWAMLARSYARLGRHADALPAYAQAVALRTPDASLLADYADAMAMNNGRKLEGEPSRLVERALALEPAHLKALTLAGAAAFERKDYAGAVGHWEKAAQVAPADSGFAGPLQNSIDQARQLAGMPKSQAAPPTAAAAPASAAAATAQAPAAAAASAVSTVTAVQGRVRLSPALAKQAAPTDTVFIFARAAEGPRMPLAILRHQVKDLPLAFKLDDSTAMSPATRLSLHPKVVISARISKSGQAVPAAGDLQGQSAPVANDAQGVDVEISEVVKN